MLTHGGSVLRLSSNASGGLIQRVVTTEPPCVSMRTGAASPGYWTDRRVFVVSA
jgi:hypothetical protein